MHARVEVAALGPRDQRRRFSLSTTDGHVALLANAARTEPMILRKFLFQRILRHIAKWRPQALKSRRVVWAEACSVLGSADPRLLPPCLFKELVHRDRIQFAWLRFGGGSGWWSGVGWGGVFLVFDIILETPELKPITSELKSRTAQRKPRTAGGPKTIPGIVIGSRGSSGNGAEGPGGRPGMVSRVPGATQEG